MAAKKGSRTSTANAQNDDEMEDEVYLLRQRVRLLEGRVQELEPLVPEPGLQAISLSALEGTLHLPFHHHFEHETERLEYTELDPESDSGEYQSVITLFSVG